MKKALLSFTSLVAAVSLVSVPTYAATGMPTANSEGLIRLSEDVDLDTTFTVNEGEDITLDLAGHKIEMTHEETITKNHEAINVNKGTLTIVDTVGGGSIVYNYTGDNTGNGGYAANTITNNQGTLVIDGVTVVNNTENKTDAAQTQTNQIAYVVDARTNGGIGDASTTIKNSVITGKKGISVRGFANSPSKTNSITIDGANLTGGVQVHDANANANKAELVINGDTTITSSTMCVYLYGVGDTSNISVDINDGTFNGQDASYGAVYLYNTTKGGAAFDASITGGTFNGDVYMFTKDSTGEYVYLDSAITGGTFTGDVSVYLADGVELDENGFVHSEDATVKLVNGSDYTYYKTLQDAVNNAVAGSTIVLTESMDNASGVVFDEDTNVTVDFNENAYIVGSNTVGSAGTETNGFQIKKGANVIFKNGTLYSTEAKILVQNYGNTTFDTMVLELGKDSDDEDVYYTLSVNAGDVKLYGSRIQAADGDIALDVYYWSQYYSDGVKVVIDENELGHTTTIFGDIVYGGDGKATDYATKAILNIENIDSYGDFIIQDDLTEHGISVSGGYFDVELDQTYLATGFVANRVYYDDEEPEDGYYFSVDKCQHEHEDSYTVVGAKEAKEGEEGYTGDVYCECGELIEEGEAIPALEKDETEDKDLDFSKLLEVAAKLEGVDLTKYTEESVAKLEKAIEAYNDLMDEEEVTQEELDAVVKEIEEAVDGLELLKETDKPSGEANEGTSGSTTQKPGGVNTGDPTNAGGLAAMLLGSLGVLLKKRK